MSQSETPLTTPDGRYIVVRGRLWRKANPALSHEVVREETRRLMEARRQLRGGVSTDEQRAAARAAVQAAKVALGERGAVWWTDGTADFNRHLAKNTPYRDWFAETASDEE